MPTCGRCRSRWGGVDQVCHCGGCHLTFSGIRTYDRHRSHDGHHGRCLDPAGIAGVEWRDGMWRGPEPTARQLQKIRTRRRR